MQQTSPIQKTSDLVSCTLTTRHPNLGIKWKLEGGLDHFNESYFGKLSMRYGNFIEYNSVVVEYLATMGIVKGKNLLINDLLNRNKSRWVKDRSDKYVNGRLNVLFKDTHPILSGILHAVPYLYLEGWVSTNPGQRLAKYEMDYGLGLRFMKN
jgi:hypothetical protein